MRHCRRPRSCTSDLKSSCRFEEEGLRCVGVHGNGILQLARNQRFGIMDLSNRTLEEELNGGKHSYQTEGHERNQLSMRARLLLIG